MRWLGRSSNNIRNGPTSNQPQQQQQQQQHDDDDDALFLAQSTALIPASVYMISGCHSEETSADVECLSNQLPDPAGRSGGACTSALLELLWQESSTTSNPLSYQQLLLRLRDRLRDAGMTQIPQLSSSRPLDDGPDTPFRLIPDRTTSTTTTTTPQQQQQRALLVGINYHGHRPGELRGCINDCLHMKRYLMERHGFREANILVLVDDVRYSPHAPTRATIIAALRRLVEQSRPGDTAVFHFSGHGGLLEPTGNLFKQQQLQQHCTKEYEETLYPLDHPTAGQIRDFSLFRHFVQPMAAGVHVFCVMDCCHSGSVLNLPYSYRPTSPSSTTIRMRQNGDHLTNLAYMYILAGGNLLQLGTTSDDTPWLFHDMAQQLEQVTDGSLQD